jgi:hypothetical protein
MSGDTIAIVCSVIGLVVAGAGAAIWHGRKLGNIETRLDGIEDRLSSVNDVWNHIGDLTQRMTKIETQHDCCPVCNGDHHHE